MFTPVAHVVRDCGSEQTIRNGDNIYRIPAQTRVTCVLQGIHKQENVWGDDQADFHPTRWMTLNKTSTTSAAPASVPHAPDLQPPLKGAFLPWSAGPRICPGMKMAQVEFLSVIWTIFKEYRVCATQLDGVNLEQAQHRLRDIVLQSEPRVTLQMKKPEDAVMTWSRR
jgi:cytochrome P450